MSTDPFHSIQPDPAAGLNPVQPVTIQPRRRGGGTMFLNVLLGLALVVAVGGVAFAVGRATAPASSGSGALAADGQNGRGFFVGPGASGAPDRAGRFGGPGGAGFSIEGTVQAIDATSMTITTASGQTVTIALDGNTSYQKASAATAADVTTGSKVSVQLNGRGGGQGRPGASAAPGASGAPVAGLGTAGSVTVVP